MSPAFLTLRLRGFNDFDVLMKLSLHLFELLYFFVNNLNFVNCFLVLFANNSTVNLLVNYGNMVMHYHFHHYHHHY